MIVVADIEKNLYLIVTPFWYRCRPEIVRFGFLTLVQYGF